MSIWIGKIKDNIENYDNYNLIDKGDSIYLYTDDYESGTFLLIKKYDMIDNVLKEDIKFNEKNIDLPYTLLYKTKSTNNLVSMSEQEINFILNPILPYEQIVNTERATSDAMSSDDENISPEINFENFLEKLDISLNEVELKNITSNIQFNIGQPNTGKSYKFEESNVFGEVNSKHYKYKKIPVSGGIGNEYKGLQNTDLAITYDPIKKELRFGEFLQILMSAIVNPKVPHVVFLDDFHNQDISSLLSEYTPLFKGQQKRDIAELTDESIFDDFENVDKFIEKWNNFIDKHCKDVPIVPLTNRISGASLNLMYPSNFYLLGAANFNENSLNIFADWEDRAVINYIDPIESFTKENAENSFLVCCKKLNQTLKDILENKNIFDYEKYCFGMWKIVDKEENIITDIEEQKKLIDFFFSMIKNSLKHNNKNSEINNIGWELMVKMQENSWFKENIENLTDINDIDYKILHKHNIYEDEI